MSKTERKEKPGLVEAKRIVKLKQLLKRGDKEFNNYRAKYILKNAGTYVEVNGKDVRWDSRTKANFNEGDLKKKFLKEYYGTTTPKKDLEYLTAKQSLRFDKGRTTLGEAWQQLISKRLKDGGTTFERDEKKRFEKLDTELNKLKIGTKYSRDEKNVASEALLKNLPVETKTDIEQQTEIDKAGAKVFGPNSKVAKAGKQFKLVPPEWQNLGKIDSKTAGQLGIEYNANNVKDAPEFTTKTDLQISKDPTKPVAYEDVLKMKRGKERDRLTLKHWEDKGYNFKGLANTDKRTLANDLRIGHAHEVTGSKGSFLHIDSAFRGSSSVIKKNEV